MIDLAAPSRALGYAGGLVVVGSVVARTLIRKSWQADGDEPARSQALHRLALVTFGATSLLLFAAAMALLASARSMHSSNSSDARSSIPCRS